MRKDNKYVSDQSPDVSSTNTHIQVMIANSLIVLITLTCCTVKILIHDYDKDQRLMYYRKMKAGNNGYESWVATKFTHSMT